MMEPLSFQKRRIYGEHPTPVKIFEKYILPEIKDHLHKHVWVDLFAGDGNLILPLLNLIKRNEREDFFNRHIFLFDIQKEMVEKAVEKAMRYGISEDSARKRILQWDTIKNYPKFIFDAGLTPYHITNPPYLYLGYIVKHHHTKKYLRYFEGDNKGYQDLYQLALINDLKNGMNKMIYIIPSNFFFGSSVSNKIRRDMLEAYEIKKSIILETDIFEHTGTNVAVCFFEMKRKKIHYVQHFEGVKIVRGEVKKRYYSLKPERNYRAGSEFDDFQENFKNRRLKIDYYLTMDEVEKNRGTNEIHVIDANRFKKGKYEKLIINVNDSLYEKIKSNILFLKTIDSGSSDGRAGIYEIKKVFGVDGILVTKEKYRTHPVHIFFREKISPEEQILIKNCFNLILEYLRIKTDSEFMTTYKYSNSRYVRKYLGLSQARTLVEIIPLMEMNDEEKRRLNTAITMKDVKKIISMLSSK